MSGILDSKDSGREAHLWIAVLAAVVGIGLSVYAVIVRGQNFDFAAYGQGAGLLLAGVGAAAAGQGYQRHKERRDADISAQ